MRDVPPTPPAADAPHEIFESGHLWLLEQIAGASLRFQLAESGLIRFGTRERTYANPDDVPLQYQHAVRHVRERLDRDALRRAVADVSDVTFFGISTHRRGVDYDWTRLPSFLGTEVWSATESAFRPPDAAAGIFDRLGLESVNAIEREVRARDFDPASYAIPESAWYDGPAAGVVVRNKGGQRALLPNPELETRDEQPVEPITASAETVVADFLTEQDFEQFASGLEERGRAVTVDALADRGLEAIYRRIHHRLEHPDTTIDRRALRTALATNARRFLDE